MKCPICENSKYSRISHEYKFEIPEDQKYFGNLQIACCEKCDFNFAFPMPKEENLNYFYEKVYRSKNRPPYWVSDFDEDAEIRYLDDKNLNYLLYLSTLIDLNKIKNIYDFGAGYGDLGYLLKKQFDHINLYCTEGDFYASKILAKRKYINNEVKFFDKKFDLIISLHSLEHLTNLEIFKFFHKNLTDEGLFFFEVPYCPKKYFEGRPYDGPHLLFYTEKSIKKICEKYNFEIFKLDYSSYSFDMDHEYQRQSQSRYYDINSLISFSKLKLLLKKIVPYKIIKLKNDIQKLKNINSDVRINSFVNNKKDNCYLRVILKKKN